MRPSLPPDMGDNAAAQATLEQRLRREQIKPVTRMEELKNWSGNATDGQVAKYTQATGTWGPGTVGGIQGDRLAISLGTPQSIANGIGSVDTDIAWDTTDETVGSSIQLPGTGQRPAIYQAGVYLLTLQVQFASNATGSRAMVMIPQRGYGAQADQYVQADPATVTRLQSTMWLTVDSSMLTMGALGDHLDIATEVGQNSGGALNLLSSGAGLTAFRALRLA